MSPVRTRVKDPDEVCAQAVDIARAAAVDVAGPAGVGEHVGAHADAERVVTHLFGSLDPAYQGWRWAVTVARAARAKNVTVSETVLLPGPDSILAPDWVPWRERLRPGDLGVGDILPAPADDERLAPAVALEGEDGLAEWEQEGFPGAADVIAPAPAAPGGTAEEAADRARPEEAGAAPGSVEAPSGEAGGGQAPSGEAGGGQAPSGEAGGGQAGQAGQAMAPGPERAGGRGGGQAGGERLIPAQARLLSAIGRDDAALRWYAGEHGPASPLAHAAPGVCAGCGFFVRVSGPLGQVFGVCANAYAPDDGRVVSVDHGCGAHSEGAVAYAASMSAAPVIDELGYDLVDRPGVSVEETDFEPLGG